MSWHLEIDELRRREEMARGMGEPDKIKRQLGRKWTVPPRTVRPRIECLMELGSFQEIGASAGIPMRP
jgi:acetyl-CoA carboxylase carboxyltransferase component